MWWAVGSVVVIVVIVVVFYLGIVSGYAIREEEEMINRHFTEWLDRMNTAVQKREHEEKEEN